MTSVAVMETDDIYEVCCINHADDARTCAAISMMITALANWVVDSGGTDEQRLDPGYAVVIIPKSIPGSAAICRLAEVAFGQLAEQDPGHVTFLNYRQKCGADSEEGHDTI